MGSFISDKDESNFIRPPVMPDADPIHSEIYSSSPADRKRFFEQMAEAMELGQGFQAWSYSRLDSTVPTPGDEWILTSSVAYGLEIYPELPITQMLERLQLEQEFEKEDEKYLD